MTPDSSDEIHYARPPRSENPFPVPSLKAESLPPSDRKFPLELNGALSSEVFDYWQGIMGERRTLFRALNAPITELVDNVIKSYVKVARILRQSSNDIGEVLRTGKALDPNALDYKSILRKDADDAMAEFIKQVNPELLSGWLGEAQSLDEFLKSDSYKAFIWSLMIMIDKTGQRGESEFSSAERAASPSKKYKAGMHTHVDISYWLTKLGYNTELARTIGFTHDVTEHGNIIGPWGSNGVILKPVKKENLTGLLEGRDLEEKFARLVSLGVQALSEEGYQKVEEVIGEENFNKYKRAINPYLKRFGQDYPDAEEEDFERIFLRGPLIFGTLGFQEYKVIESLCELSESGKPLKNHTPEEILDLAEAIFFVSIADRMSDVAYVRRYIDRDDYFSNTPEKARHYIIANLNRFLFFQGRLERSFGVLSQSKIRAPHKPFPNYHEVQGHLEPRALGFLEDFMMLRLADANRGLREHGVEEISIEECFGQNERVFHEVYSIANNFVGSYAENEARRIVATLG